jgi:hypothetical protein
LATTTTLPALTTTTLPATTTTTLATTTTKATTTTLPLEPTTTTTTLANDKPFADCKFKGKRLFGEMVEVTFAASDVLDIFVEKLNGLQDITVKKEQFLKSNFACGEWFVRSFQTGTTQKFRIVNFKSSQTVNVFFSDFFPGLAQRHK